MKKNFLSLFATLAMLMVVAFCMVIVCYGYNSRYECFNNQHVVDGGQNLSYSILDFPYSQQTALQLDCNSIISTGVFRIGVRPVDSNGAVLGVVSDIRRVEITSTSQNINGYYYSNAVAGLHKACIYGDDGVHFILNRAYLHYNQ